MNTDKTENQTIEKSDNELIAEFMGNKAIFDTDGNRIGVVIGYNIVFGYRNGPTTIASLEYNVSWDWLMPVLQKIRGLFQNNELFEKGKEKWSLITLCLETTEIESVYLAVVEFISWYNSQKVKTDTEV